MEFTGPLLFDPIYQTRVWGGDLLESELGRTLPAEIQRPVGESWELVDRPECSSVVANGPARGKTLTELWAGYRVQVFGPNALNCGRGRFPLLIKVLDCGDDLSIQVHPPEAQAEQLGGEPKSEMWYVLGAKPGARIIAGLKPNVTAEDFRSALSQGSVAACIHEVHPRTGDCMMVPSGRLHALGAGLLVFEVQQNSDTTYRVYDWDRLGLDGKPRETHVEQSLTCIDFNDVEPALNHAEVDQVVAECDFFRVTRSRTGHPRILMALETTQWGGTSIDRGRVAIWPASLPPQQPQGEWLEIEVPW
ncbi:MAG: class I mannose-6-phosphate isomerase [Verrucomicrobiaceae bacterium]|nr:class I mannose-6-phosphate isomerase [Verrucomicrobiaceae bacterium]